MNALIRRIVAVAALACLHAAASASPFFRVTYAGPGQIFQEGFVPWGTNNNLLAHTRGLNCNRDLAPGAGTDERSTYTSMSATLEAALRAARQRLEKLRATGAVQQTIWIYEIRPTHEMFNVAQTFEAAHEVLQAGPLRAPYLNAMVLREWVTPRPVPTTLIREARQYRLENDVPVEVPGTAVTNARYVDAPEVINTAPLPPSVVTGATPGRAMGVLRTAAGAMSACWCDASANRPTLRAATPETPAAVDPVALCTSQVEYINDVTPTVRYFPTNGWKVEIR